MEKPPSFEVQRALYQTVEHTVRERLPGGDVVEQAIEDNGRTQRRCVDKVSYGTAGEVIFAEQLSREELG
jgi:hypothetical protein